MESESIGNGVETEVNGVVHATAGTRRVPAQDDGDLTRAVGDLLTLRDRIRTRIGTLQDLDRQLSGGATVARPRRAAASRRKPVSRLKAATSRGAQDVARKEPEQLGAATTANATGEAAGSNPRARVSSFDVDKAVSTIVDVATDWMRSEQIQQATGLDAKLCARALKRGFIDKRLVRRGQKRATEYKTK